MQKFRFSNPIHCQSAVLIRLGRGVRPWSWTGSRGGFDPLPGVVILELRGAQVAKRGVQPARVVDLVNEAGKIRGDVLKCFVLHKVDMQTSPSIRSST